ncbi:MAG: BspA family leucine-rich repeat surface protein, partial [Atopobiaceae bacterium]|nr:BspA family leucine-rich repeat surface protein [Atopobiaceae bacterium]
MGKSAWNAANSTNKQIDSTQTRGLFATRTARTTHTLRTPRALMYALIAALLALTAVLALPRVVYASIVGPTAWADNLTWEITDAGELIIKPADATKRAAIGSSAYSPQGSAEQASKEKWPWHAYREQITKVTMSAHTAAGKPAIETYGDGRLAYMFADMPNLTEADVSGLLTTRVQDVRGMFKNCSSLTELDLSEWINNGSMQYMQDLCNGCSSLTKFTLNNKDFHTKVIKAATHAADYKTYTLYEGMNGGTKTYNVGIQEDETKGSCQSQRMFDGCDALEEIDMQNITISTWKKPEEGDANQNTFIRSIRNLPNIKKINMNGIKLPGLKAGVLGGEFVFHKDTLEEFYFGNVDVDDSLNDSTHDAIYETALEEVVDKLIEGCSALQIIDLSGWDTSAIGEKEPDAEGNYIVFGFKELMEDYGAPLQKLIAEDAKIWMHTKDPVSVNGTIAPYDISDGLQANENDESGDALANLHIDWHFNFTTDADDSGETVYNLESNPDDAHTLHGVIGTENGYGNLASGTYIVGSPTEPRDPWKDDEGITTIPQTYYTVKSLSNAKLYISEDGGASYTEVDPTDNSWNWQKEPGGDTAKYIERGDYHIQNSNGWRIFSRNMSVNEWDTKTQGNEAKLNDNVKLRFVYEQAAVDVNGKLHDVAVDINNVTFKDMDKIPILGEDYKVDPYGVNPWIPGTSYDAGTFSNGTPYDAGTFNRTDQDRLVGSAPDGTGGYLYDKNQTYTRQLITAQGNTLEFWNQIRKSTNLVSSSTGYALDKELLSKGSGTYIDYNITVDGALPDTSVLFWMGDLDVAHSQEWEMHESNMNQDRMISDAYGPGSEGIVLGSGNDLDTLTTARNTGLDRYTYDSSDYNNSQSDANGNYIVGSGTDPNTSWSRFYLRADAQGANYIWTSGISCKTEILGAANVTVDSLPPVYVIPEARKTVNYALPTGEYKDAFSFTIAKADEISDIEYEYTWWDGVGQDATSTQERVTLPNSVDDDFSETRSNDGGVVPFSTLTFTAPGSTDPEDAWSEGFDPHKYNEHRAKAYIYRITEEIPDNADDSVLKYNREKVVYYLKVVVTNPKTDLEMHKGTRADVTMGE